MVPITVKVPLKEAKKRKNTKDEPKTGKPKKFQVCQKKACHFFRWLVAGNPHSCKQESKFFFGTCCSKHFLLKEHIENQQQERRIWWEANCREYSENNPDLDLASSSAKQNGAHVDPLTIRLLTVASMAFTQIPRLLSEDSPDSVLILMR